MLLVDARASSPSLSVRALCDRQHGIGADGLILVEPSHIADFRMRYFNADGSEAAMCGNGLRCVKHFLRRLGHTERCLTIETGAGPLKAWEEEGEVAIEIAPVRLLEQHGDGYRMEAGVPHRVIFVEELEALPRLEMTGNVNFVRPLSHNSLALRTFERGVGETLACGTGATAAALAYGLKMGLPSGPVQVEVRSGERLEVNFSLVAGDAREVSLRGPVEHLFDGQLPLDCGSMSIRHG